MSGSNARGAPKAEPTARHAIILGYVRTAIGSASQRRRQSRIQPSVHGASGAGLRKPRSRRSWAAESPRSAAGTGERNVQEAGEPFAVSPHGMKSIRLRPPNCCWVRHPAIQTPVAPAFLILPIDDKVKQLDVGVLCERCQNVTECRSRQLQGLKAGHAKWPTVCPKCQYENRAVGQLVLVKCPSYKAYGRTAGQGTAKEIRR
jgi:hypothetical protein